MNIAEAAEKAAAEAEANGESTPDEEVKISLTVFEDEDLGDLPDEEEEEAEEPAKGEAKVSEEATEKRAEPS